MLTLLCLPAAGLTGCKWWQSQMPKEEGFQDWNTKLGGDLRGNAAEAKDSGFFWGNKKAAQIEKNLGGGFD